MVERILEIMRRYPDRLALRLGEPSHPHPVMREEFNRDLMEIMPRELKNMYQGDGVRLREGWRLALLRNMRYRKDREETD